MRKIKFFIGFFLFLGIASVTSVAANAQTARAVNKIDMVQTDKYMYMSEPNEGVVYVFDNNDNGSFVKKISLSYAGSPFGVNGEQMNLLVYNSNTVTSNHYVFVSFPENNMILVISEQTLSEVGHIQTTKKPYDLAYDNGYLLVTVSHLNNSDYLPFSVKINEGSAGLPQREPGTVDYQWQNSEINVGTVFIGDENIESVGANQFAIFGADLVKTFETYSTSLGIPTYVGTGDNHTIESYPYDDYVLDSTGTYGYYVGNDGNDFKKVHILQEPGGLELSEFELNDQTNSLALSHDDILYVGMSAPDGPDVIQYEILPGVTPAPMIRYLLPSHDPLLINGLSASAKAVYAVTPEYVYLLDGNTGSNNPVTPVYSFIYGSDNPAVFLAISDFNVKNITKNSAEICWEYDYPGTKFYLQWGEDQATLDGSNYQVKITNHGYCYTIGDSTGVLLLKPATTYFVQVKSSLDSIPSTSYLAKSNIISFSTLSDSSTSPTTYPAVAPKPDLVVSNITFTSPNNQINENGKLAVTIRNDGVALTSAKGLAHWQDDADFGVFQGINSAGTLSSYVVSRALPSIQTPLATGEEITFTWSGKFTKPGWQAISYNIDSLNLLDEENESNNITTKEFYIGESGETLSYPDLVIAKVVQKKNSKGEGYLEFYYKNTGKAQIPNSSFKVSIAIDGNPIDNLLVKIDPDNQKIGTFIKADEDILFNPDPGTHKVRFVIDSDNEVAELNENNNIYTKRFFISKPGINQFHNKEKLAEMKKAARELINDNISIILDQIGGLRDTIREQSTKLRYLNKLSKSVSILTDKMQNAINNFITYGVDNNTKALGEGERAAVMYSYKAAYNKLPETEEELADAIKIANGRWPSILNEEAETKAREQFQKIYKKIPNMSNQHDNAAVTVMAYGLRQSASNRNLASEKEGIKTFTAIYGHHPKTTEDWNIMQAITYSGSSRGVDTDGDFLIDERELALGTDPNNRDTDGDGYIDGIEVANGFDPLSGLKY